MYVWPWYTLAKQYGGCEGSRSTFMVACTYTLIERPSAEAAALHSAWLAMALEQLPAPSRTYGAATA